MRETSMNVLGKRPDGELLPATPAVFGELLDVVCGGNADRIAGGFQGQICPPPVLESPAGHWPAISATLIQATSS